MPAPNLASMLKHKLTQFILVLVVGYLFFQFGIPALSRALTGVAAPVPSHLLWTIFMPILGLVMLLYVSANEASWREFTAPLQTLLIERERRQVVALRRAILVALPLLVGLAVFLSLQSGVSPPAELRSVHPAPPASITFDGKMIDLQTAINPFRDASGEPDPAALTEGKAIYGQQCVFCHGDALNGDGLFADSLRPRPANFTDPGTIAQLQETYLFWRIAKGGPGLPPEGKGWNSAMPAWEGTLTEDEIWKVILYLYDATNQQPREAGLE
ncbi:MAG TPA: cytochrome c [Anaerolineae bacterium]|nr:cytochrome c [Anaerolineae bacterium]